MAYLSVLRCAREGALLRGRYAVLLLAVRAYYSVSPRKFHDHGGLAVLSAESGGNSPPPPCKLPTKLRCGHCGLLVFCVQWSALPPPRRAAASLLAIIIIHHVESSRLNEVIVVIEEKARRLIVHE